MGLTASTTKYSAKTSSTDIMAEFGSKATDKYVIVTGANCGIGWETARALAEYGAHVVIACRNEDLATEAVQKIKDLHPSAHISAMKLDLASLQSVDEFTREYKRKQIPLHVLINNAGVMACPLQYTKDGHEMQFGVNHLGHFALTMKLLPILKSTAVSSGVPSRVVILSSAANFLLSSSTVPIKFDDLKGEANYDCAERYGGSKVANILFAKEFNRRYGKKDNVISVALHPGVVGGSGIGRNLDFPTMRSMMSALFRNNSIAKALYYSIVVESKNLSQGAATSLYCSLASDVVPGEYYSHCQVEHQELHLLANDEALAAKLWNVSTELTKITE